MVLTVYGFPSKVMALRFEWCWQNPKESLLSRNVVSLLKGLGKATEIPCKIRVLYELLNLPPFSRLALNVHWLTQSYHRHLVGCPPPPKQMTVNCGTFDQLYLYSLDSWLQPRAQQPPAVCELCAEEAGEEALSCGMEGCLMRGHVLCLANFMLLREPQEILPTHAPCPSCGERLVWGKMVMEAQKIKRRKLEDANITI